MDRILNISSVRPVERIRLLVLIGTVAVLSILLSLWAVKISLWTLTAGYALFYCVLDIAAGLDRRRAACKIPTTGGPLPCVSIIISVHNEVQVISETIRNLLALDYPDFELLVFDDRSTDETAKLLEELRLACGNRFQLHRRHPESRPGKSAALNEAMAACKHDILCILDADAFVEKDFLKKLVPYMAHKQVAATQARKAIRNVKQNWLTQCQQYEYSLDAYLQAKQDQIYGAVNLRGNGFLVKKYALEAVGGWNESSLTEDLDLSTRLQLAGWDLRYASEVCVWEQGSPFLMPLFRQRLRWTEGCLVRCLEYAPKSILSKQVSLQSKLNLTAFLFQFVIPIWTLMEQLARLSGLARNPVLYSTPAIILLSAYFLYTISRGIFKFNRVTVPQTLTATVMTYLYLSCLWLPIVYWLMLRISTRRERNLTWYKTPRYEILAG